MSGGHYDYAFYRIRDLCVKIQYDITTCEIGGKDEYGWERYKCPDDILEHMQFIHDSLLALADAAHDIEWYVSGDYGDDCLRECDSWSLSKNYRKQE